MHAQMHPTSSPFKTALQIEEEVRAFWASLESATNARAR